MEVSFPHMTQETQFSSDQEERWSEISNFPGYKISSRGSVFNVKHNREVKPTRKAQGLLMVGLMKDCVQHKRSLPLLVARAFVPNPHGEAFDTPIHLDGNQENVHYANLRWRPLWFARKYHRQFNDEQPKFPDPLEDVETGELYVNSRHASVSHGILDEEIRLSMLNNTYVWPTGQIFREAVEN